MIWCFFIKTITGIAITDLFLKRIHEFSQVANIFVNTRDEEVEW